MSTFCFIATDKELPEVDYTNRQIITLRETIAKGSIKEDIGGYKFKKLDAPMKVTMISMLYKYILGTVICLR